MKTSFIARCSAAIAFCLSVLVGVAAPDESQSVGLVLSGGGAKGIAHIGVIQALEENDIPIDFITGTSMGAIVGGLYAAGYTPDEMMELILSKGFSYWSTGQINPEYVYYFSKEDPSPSMLTVPIATARDSARIDSTSVPASLISPLPMSYAFMQLFSKYTAQCEGDFDRLFVPFRCCASDAAAHRRVVLGKGDFGDAIRSSMSFPIVFQPTEFDGMLLYDGGIYDNFPADVMRDTFAPDFVLGIDVSTIDKGPQTSLMDQIENLVIQNNDYYLDPSNGIKIRFDLNRFSLLDFPQAKAIYQIGYDQTIAMMDSIKSRIHTRVPKEARKLRRDVFKSKTPYVRFDSVDVSGASPKQCYYIKEMFRPEMGADTFGLDRATTAYYRAVSTGKLNDLQPHALYNDSTGLFRLTLRASVKDDLKAQVGGYIASSNLSYIYLSAGYSTLAFNALSANVSGWIGQSYLAGMIKARSVLPTSFTSAIDLMGVAHRRNYDRSDNLDFNSESPSFVRHHEYYGRLRWTVAVGSKAKAIIGIGGGHIYDNYYMPLQEIDNDPTRDHSHFNLGQIEARYESSTLNDLNYPTSGRMYKFSAMGIMGNHWMVSGDTEGRTDTERLKWLQFESVTRNYFKLSRHFSLGVESDVMLSTRKLLKSYNASIVAAPYFAPTPSAHAGFFTTFRANSFIAAGIVPVYMLNDNLSARLSLNAFVPIRKIERASNGGARYGSPWLGKPKYFNELSVCYTLPFATLTGYCNYSDAPGHKWNVGLSFGVFLFAPEFLR